MATSRTAIFLRSCFVVFVIYMMLSTTWNWMSGTYFSTPFEMAVSAILTVACFGGISWLITNIGMGLLFGRSVEYRAYRENGGDPFCDSLPWPISQKATHRFQCPKCGAPAKHCSYICGECGYKSETP